MKTNNKESILISALKLFADESFASVTTKRIAKEAGVSEGLVFKHYKNKETLFEEVINECHQRLYEKLKDILELEDAKHFIKEMIMLPVETPKSEHDFWRFHFKLKWDGKYDPKTIKEPLVNKFTWAFKELNYNNPEAEAELIMLLLDSLAVNIFRDEDYQSKEMGNYLIKKYNLV